MRRQLVALLVFVLLASLVAFSAKADCLPVVVGVDSAQANNSAGSLLGEGIGETFFAADTVVNSLTVWRVQDVDAVGMHLFFVGVDSTGRPEYNNVILDGPALNMLNGHVFTWVFDPPFVLPRPGMYAFFLFTSPCIGLFDILGTDQPDTYPQGQLWATGRSECVMNGDLRAYPADLSFHIEFCHDAITATHRTTWGRLKMRYR
jgi:hypothetical protein